MSIEYILISDYSPKGRNVSRIPIDRFKAYDDTMPLWLEYGGKLKPTSPLFFETKEEAARYLERATWLKNRESWKIAKYNVSCAYIEREE